ncbi:MAG: hypothetical protein COB76_05330 [Alphaproteobacteria bacterium]|nr:MAG: hypothetical protein COB76_05330 [Alphaproteobacteria bacterium]
MPTEKEMRVIRKIVENSDFPPREPKDHGPGLSSILSAVAKTADVSAQLSVNEQDSSDNVQALKKIRAGVGIMFFR